MSDRYDFFYRQKVTEGELDDAFDALEAADRNMVVDLGFTGVAHGLVVSERDTPGLSVDVSSGAAHDPQGRRIRIASGQVVDLSVDSDGVPTTVSTPGNARVVSVFAVFSRALSDPRIDGNSNTVYFVRAESFSFRVVQGSEATLGAEVAPALANDATLLADVRRTNGQTEILDAAINPYTPSRRQEFDFGLDESDVTALIASELADGPTITNATISGDSTRWTGTEIVADGHARGKLRQKLAGTTTSNSTTATLYSWTIVDEAVTTVTVEVSAVKTDGTLTGTYVRRVRIKRDGGTVSLGNVDDVYTDRESGFSALVVTIDNSGSTGRVRVTGIAATNIDWFGVITRIEHTHA